MRKTFGAIALLILFTLGTAGALAVIAASPTTGTVTACATATTPAHTVAVDGAGVSTIPAATATNCTTTTYTVPTVTTTQTVTTTAAGTTTTAPTTTTTPTTTTAPTTTTTPAPAPAPTFTTSLTQNGTITTPYVWTFDPGVATTAGYFWADGTLLAKITGPGPYMYTLEPGVLTSGAHTLGHAWDLASDGSHHSPASGYAETISNPAAPSPNLLFNGLAAQMNSMTSTGYAPNNVASQDPAVFACLCYVNNDIEPVADATFGKAFNVNAEPGSRGPGNSGLPANDASSQLSFRQVYGGNAQTEIGQTEYYGIAVKVPSATWHNPDWSSLMSLGYETFDYDQLALDINPHGTNGAESFDLMQNAGYANCPTTTCNASGALTTPMMDVVYDKWLDFVYAVKWATDNTGFIRVYYRPSGGTWSLLKDRENVPTAAYGKTSYGCVDANLNTIDCSTGAVQGYRGTIDKFGLYYGYWNAATTSFPQETIQESGVIQAATLADAEAALR